MTDGITPQWEPPGHLLDPIVCRLPMDRAQWSRAIRGRIPALREQAVALHLANYGNKNGSSCHPGIKNLAADTCASPSTVKRALAWLDETGWINCTQRSSGRRDRSDVYELSIPAPVAAELGLWNPADNGAAQWVERPRYEPKRAAVAATGARHSRPFTTWSTTEPGVNSDPSLIAEPGVRSGEPGVRSGEPGVTVDPPPGPTTPGPTTPFSDSIAAHTLPRAGSTLVSDETDMDDHEQLLAYIETELGGPCRRDTETMILGMASEGRNWRAIANAAIANERDRS